MDIVRSSLYVFAGFPGSGKTTLSRHLARKLKAVHLRIDTIEQALRETGGLIRGHEGYVVAYQLAADNLRLGLPVIADSVNPLQITRVAWRDVATSAGVPIVEVEIICSDVAEHRKRFESRAMENEGTPRITWADVQARLYEPWDIPPLVIDTAGRTVVESIAELERALDARLR